jgi:ATP-dependent RNA helicase DDX21
MNILRKREHVDTENIESQTVGQEEISGNFDNFPISELSKKTLQRVGIKYLFPIQASTFMPIFEGRDLIGKDRTGSGKTLAFSLPILEKLRSDGQCFTNARGQSPFVVVLVPTRELCMQVSREFTRFMNNDKEYRVLPVYGGTDAYEQVSAMRNGIEILIGTPGRLIDLMDRKAFNFRSIRHFILDETDQMLNIGFQEDIERILKTVRAEFEENQKSIDKIQFLLFSATVPRWVDQIASKFMKKDLVFVDMIKNSETKTSKTVEHLALFFPSKEHKIEAIGDLVLVYGGAHSRTIIFTDTKEEANEVALRGQLKIECQVLHGDIPQKQREITFTAFRNGSLKCLVATNVAARGLDIPEVDLIVQLAPPKDIETYIHRSGRTGRAGKIGTCITFYTKRQQEFMDKIENMAKMKFKKIGAPQPSDIMRSNARDISCSFDNVSSDVLVYFQDNVKSILEKYTPDEAICRALAVISGYTKSVQQRSLLFSVEGYVTYKMELDHDVRSPTHFWGLLKKYFSPTITENIKGMRFLKNHKGVVFDLKEDDKKLFDQVAETITEEGLTIEVATELPEFEDRMDSGPAPSYNSGYGGNRYGGNSGYGSSGAYGGSGGYGANLQRPAERFTNSNFNAGTHRPFTRTTDGPSNTLAVKDDCKLFVANLPFDFQEKDIQGLCDSKGIRPIDVYLVRNPDRTSKGFGYLKFNDSRSAQEAMSQISITKIGGRSLRVDYADKR